MRGNRLLFVGPVQQPILHPRQQEIAQRRKSMKNRFLCLGIPAMLFALSVGVFGQDIKLVEPQAKIGLDLFDAIRARTSETNFVKHDMSLSDLSVILWAGNGLTRPHAAWDDTKSRTIPYPVGVFPLGIYVLTASGLYRYDEVTNVLVQRLESDVRAQVTSEYIESAPLMLLFTYGLNPWGPFASNPELVREISIEVAGCAVENISLTASALNMGAVVTYDIGKIPLTVAAKLGESYPLLIMQLGYLK
jgi:hypothetical protein